MYKYLIVGLGNPGRRYAKTRHNIGFQVVDSLAKRVHVELVRRLNEAAVGVGRIGGHEVLLAKPQTYMNRSGRAVRGLLGRFRLHASDLIVVYDDMDLPLGRIRLRERGSAGGHRGVQSIIDGLGTNEFHRVRIGIGRPTEEDPIEYVLRPFQHDEQPIIAEAVATAVAAVEAIAREGIVPAMNSFNRDLL